MTSLRRQILLKAFKLFDLVVMVLSFALATVVVYYQNGMVSFAEFLTMRVKVQNFALFLGFLLVWHIIFSLFGLYHSRRLSTRRTEVIDIIKATSLGTLTIFISAIMFNIEMVTPVFLGVFWAGSNAIAVMSRLVLRYTLARIRVQGRNLRHMLIVGTNQRAIQFAQKRKELGYLLVGFVDDEWAEIGEFLKSGHSLVAHLNDFPAFLRDRVVDEVVIGLPMKSFYDQASRIVALCEEQGIVIRFLSNIFNLKLAQSKIEQFQDDPLVKRWTSLFLWF
jgi:FlaA1/EpsC-like NDP-sugar epimerase